jgi:dTDP-4-amino-4,6-dideoxygalactose transaminase
MELRKVDFRAVEEFERQVAEFFGAPYSVAVDSCTHGVELSLRYTHAKKIYVPNRTYLSIPFLAEKLGIERIWTRGEWIDFYYLTENVIDAAVLWKRGSYIKGTFMSLSFQYQKHLSLGRGGMILLDDLIAYRALQKMAYDGRLPGIPWRAQNINAIGYHYYMTPETAEAGILKLPEAIETSPRQWHVSDWPDLTQMNIFKKDE